MTYSPYFWLIKSNMASAVGNFTDSAIRRHLSRGMPALRRALEICSWVSSRLRISGSAMSMAKRERRVKSFSMSSLVFLLTRKDSTMFVPAEPSPISCTLFWYIRVFYHIPTKCFRRSFTESKFADIARSIFAALIVKPSKSLIWSSTTSVK